MKRVIIAVVVGLLVTPAIAKPWPTFEDSPPRSYNKPYKGKVVTINRSFPEVQRICGDGSWACQWFSKRGTCIVVMTRIGARVGGRAVNHQGYWGTWHHEVNAHCNRWGYGHKGGHHPRARDL